MELALIRLSNIDTEKKNLIRDAQVLNIPEVIKPGDNKKPVEQIIETLPKPVTKPVTDSVKTPEKKTVLRESGRGYEISPKISIKDALNAAKNSKIPDDPDAGSEEENLDENPEIAYAEEPKPVSEELLGLCWTSFAGQIREDKPRMAVTLKSVQPVISENWTIRLQLSNGSQLEDFNNTTKSDLEKFLQHEMHNNRIRIEATLMESDEGHQTKLYTNEEKFKYLSQKNPVLTTFRQKLNLELE